MQQEQAEAAERAGGEGESETSSATGDYSSHYRYLSPNHIDPADDLSDVSSGLGAIDISTFNEVVEDERTGVRYTASPEDIDAFERARQLNPKRIRSSGQPAHGFTISRPPRRALGPAKCATIDCGFGAGDESIFCQFCDNEHLKPQGQRRHSSGSPSGEIADRRRRLNDKKRGIEKAITL